MLNTPDSRTAAAYVGGDLSVSAANRQLSFARRSSRASTSCGVYSIEDVGGTMLRTRREKIFKSDEPVCRVYHVQYMIDPADDTKANAGKQIKPKFCIFAPTWAIGWLAGGMIFHYYWDSGAAKKMPPVGEDAFYHLKHPQLKEDEECDVDMYAFIALGPLITRNSALQVDSSPVITVVFCAEEELEKVAEKYNDRPNEKHKKSWYQTGVLPIFNFKNTKIGEDPTTGNPLFETVIEEYAVRGAMWDGFAYDPNGDTTGGGGGGGGGGKDEDPLKDNLFAYKVVVVDEPQEAPKKEDL